MYDLIIFDCDGTLVDTEYLNNKVSADLLARLGFPQYTVDYNLAYFAGKSMPDIKKAVEQETGKTLPDDFVDQYAETVTQHMPDLLRQIEGVHEVVQHYHGKTKMCVGSNGERQNVLGAIEITELTGFFPPQHIFTKDMVKRGKPAPDLFLFAAEKMGADPARTVVIEDSITGAAAGIAACMTVIGFTGTFHDQAAQERALRAVGVEHVTGSFHEIIGLIDQAAALLTYTNGGQGFPPSL